MKGGRGGLKAKKKKLGSAETGDNFTCGLYNPLRQIWALSCQAVLGKWLSTS